MIDPKIKMVDIGDLIPYVNNARTHSDEQVAQIAASIKAFGWTNPVLTDGKNGIIAGHGRIAGARKLGLTHVPVIELGHLSKSAQRNGVKDCICNDCGAEFTVRKDTNPKVCKRCGSARGGKACKGKYRVKRVPCNACGKAIRETLNYTYCSVECRNKENKEHRECKFCKKQFSVLKSTLSSKTNSSGNFCSRKCYNDWMCVPDRSTGRGSQWRMKRNKALKENPFCALCGTMKKLDVHHIIPFRIDNDNSSNNLIPLCKKHHKIVEIAYWDVELTQENIDTTRLVFTSILKEHQSATRMFLKKLAARKYKNATA